MKIIKQKKPLLGEVDIPGDKSISHRVLIIASQANGKSKIFNLSKCLDVQMTMNALISLGINIEKDGDSFYVYGSNYNILSKPPGALFLGNSGTSTRLLMGLVSPFNIEVEFFGDQSLSKRPMNRVLKPLEEMGIKVKPDNTKTLPCVVTGCYNLKPIHYNLEVPSAQIKSAILLAAMNIEGKTTIIENHKTRNHTEIMLKLFGADISVNKQKITIFGSKELSSKEYYVAGDPSSAAFIVAAALCIKDSEICLKNVCINEQRIGFYKILQAMGGNISFLNQRTICGEKVADIRVVASELFAINIPPKISPSMIDEYPILAVVCAYAKGATVMYGLNELKYKESNRLELIFSELSKCGVEVIKGDDWLSIKGLEGNITGGVKINTMNDHRIAMSFIVLGMLSNNYIEIDDISSISSSFPEFFEILGRLNGRVDSL